MLSHSSKNGELELGFMGSRERIPSIHLSADLMALSKTELTD